MHLMVKVTLTTLIALAANVPFTAQSSTINANCSLTIDGNTRFSDKCHFQASRDGIDTFNDMKLLVVCPNGKSTTMTRCEGAQQKVARKGVFGYLYRDGSGQNGASNGLSANICWNEGYMRKAESCFDGLTRDGACWKSNYAKARHGETWHKVRFCAYAL